jgi:lipopolysaccharide transport system permease protein
MFREIIRIYEYRELLKNTIKKDLQSRYKSSVLGFFWTILNPLLMLVVYSIVFSVVMRIQVPGYNYSLFLFTGLVPWMFLATTLQQSTMAIVGNANLIKKIYFPRIILPMSIALANLINMLLTLFLVLLASWHYGGPITSLYLYLLVIISVETIFVMACSITLACLTVYLRDLEHIVSVITMAWFYLTPVVYPVSFLPPKYMAFFKLNPMASIIESFHQVLIFGKTPDLTGLLYTALFSILFLYGAYATFNRLQRRFAEEL